MTDPKLTPENRAAARETCAAAESAAREAALKYAEDASDENRSAFVAALSALAPAIVATYEPEDVSTPESAADTVAEDFGAFLDTLSRVVKEPAAFARVEEALLEVGRAIVDEAYGSDE